MAVRGNRRQAVVAALMAVATAACGGSAGSGSADPVPSDSSSASTATTDASTTAPADTVPATTVQVSAGTGSGFGGALSAGWQPFVTADMTMGVPADWFDVKPTVDGNPATKASMVDAVQGQVPGATEANVDDYLDGLDVWLGRIGPGAAMTMLRAAADPTRRFPASDDSDHVQLFAETLKSNPPIAGITETVTVATIGDQRVVVADRSPSLLGDLPATERSYYLIVDRRLVSVNFITTGEPDFALWEQMVATVEVPAER